jgi:hypothetical protein
MNNRFLRMWTEIDDTERALVGLRISIGNRVRRVCLDMTELDFDKMVDSMARVHLKYEMLA